VGGDCLNLNRLDMHGGYALYVFNLEPNFGRASESEYMQLQKQGSLRLEVQFAKALAETVSVVIYSETPGYFEIDKARNVIV